MNKLRKTPLLTPLLAASVFILISGCGLLDPKATPLPSFYILSKEPTETGVTTPSHRTDNLNAPVLVIHQLQAAPGYDNTHMVYFRDPLKLEYFAHSEWVDTPARMLAPLLVAAFDDDPVFRAALLSPTPSHDDLSLDVVIVRLQQAFETRPSHIRLTLRATVTDNANGRLLARREFDEQETAPSDDPHGGVVAANAAVTSALEQLVVFCNEAAAIRQH